MADEVGQSAAQERLRAAYDPQRFREASERWANLLATHLEKVQQRATDVLNWADPESNIASAEQWLNSTTSAEAMNSPVAERFADIVQQMLDRGHNLHHPRYIGHQVPALVVPQNST